VCEQCFYIYLFFFYIVLFVLILHMVYRRHQSSIIYITSFASAFFPFLKNKRSDIPAFALTYEWWSYIWHEMKEIYLFPPLISSTYLVYADNSKDWMIDSDFTWGRSKHFFITNLRQPTCIEHGHYSLKSKSLIRPWTISNNER
jgi:hypothetical protein